MRAAIYARYSSDLQSPNSIGDQLRECREHAAQQGWTVAREFSDAAISGASLVRSGMQDLLAFAGSGNCDVVLAEALDRISRDQADVATIFKQLTYLDVSLVTIAEGTVNEMHVGLKGTMNALYLKNLADNTRRGLRGRVEAGKSGGGLCFGYEVVHHSNVDSRQAGRGELKINAEEAAIVRRIFHEYASGLSPRVIAKRLNAESIRAPRRAAWGPSTILGNVSRGTGILNNELYVGRRVWNRLRYRKNPQTGKRGSRLNRSEDWTVTEVPDLRIVSDEQWGAVKARQDDIRRAVSAGRNIGRANRPRFLFSGLMRCGACGSGFVVVSRGRCGCRGRRDQGICENRQTITVAEIEQRVLRALQERFFEPGPTEIFFREFAIAVNEVRRETRLRASERQREQAQIDRDLHRLIQAIKDGVPGDSIRSEVAALEQRKAELASVAEPDEFPLLHPAAMSQLWAAQINELRDALLEDSTDAEARQAVRELIGEIRLTPSGEGLAIEVKGDLAAMLSAASPESDRPRQLALVAGARNRCQLPEWWVAA